MQKLITIVTGGTRGDVQPLAALAIRLRTRGYAVRMIANPAFVEWLCSLGLEVVSLDDGPAPEVFADVARRTTRGVWPLSTVAEILRKKGGLPQQLDRIEQLSWNSSLLVCSEASSLVLHVADALKLPCVHVRFFPAWPTKAFPSPVVRFQSIGGILNRASHLGFNALLGLSGGPDVNNWRERRGLTRWGFHRAHREVQSRGWPLLFAMSKVLVPFPSDWSPRTTTMTGFWFLDDSVMPLSSDVSMFLATHDKVILVSLGSATGPRADHVNQVVMRAAIESKVPCLVTSTWGVDRSVDLPEHIHVSAAIPHSAILDRVSAVIHHAGAGTTAAVVRAGVPSITIPMTGEQYFWALRVAMNGLGTEPLPWQGRESSKVVSAMRSMITQGWGQKNLVAARDQVRSEPGVDSAVDIIERYIGSAH